MKNRRSDVAYGLVLGLTALMSGCGSGAIDRGLLGARQRASQPFAVQVTTEGEPSPAALAADASYFASADGRTAAGGVTPASTAVSGRVVLRKDRLFDREFLYGFDLQYSSGSDDKLSLIPQAQSLGHIPCFYRRLDDELQLVADQRRLFESDVNHPEMLIATYKILAEDDATLTVKFAAGGLVMNEVLNGPPPVAGATPLGADPVKQVWIRSLSFVPQGEYLLQESALQLKNGGVQTFMESVFPRANLVEAGDKGLENDAKVEPAASRYRFLATEEVYVERAVDGNKVRKKTTFASRFRLRDGGTIDWYVTPNAPDKFMPLIKSGVEGWNRYFKPELGRDIMRFLGRLPDGVKLGDPRYNVINFDTVAEAGAAYESQATDPLTGYQSHSLIYLPYAWYNIGAELWRKRSETLPQPTAAAVKEALSPRSPGFAFAPTRQILACARSADNVSLPAASLLSAISADGRATVPDDIDEFSKRLMMATLFHEVGHALGMAHNFKGSLAYDASKTESLDNPASWSVMDYNYYQNDQGLFKEIGGVEGPILEYDRQVLSTLYHGSKEVKESDQVLPACADDEADAVDGGVDPLCLRYDSENDPTASLVHAYHNVIAASDAQGITPKTLTQALQALPKPVGERFAAADRIVNAASLTTASAALAAQVSELVNFYVAAGAQSVRVNLDNNVKALHVWSSGVKIADEAAFRGRFVTVFKEAMAWRSLPEAPAAAAKAISAALADGASRNVALGANDADRKAAGARAAALFEAELAKHVAAVFGKLRATTYPLLVFDLKNPYALQVAPNGEASHFEALTFKALAAGVTLGFEDGTKPQDDHTLQAERLIAAAALLTYKEIAPDYAAILEQLKSLSTNALASGHTLMVTDLRQLLAKLQ